MHCLWSSFLATWCHCEDIAQRKSVILWKCRVGRFKGHNNGTWAISGPQKWHVGNIWATTMAHGKRLGHNNGTWATSGPQQWHVGNTWATAMARGKHLKYERIIFHPRINRRITHIQRSYTHETYNVT